MNAPVYRVHRLPAAVTLSQNKVQGQLLKKKAYKSTEIVKDPAVTEIKDTKVKLLKYKQVVVNGKKHSLLTAKEYSLKEYNDVFQGAETFPGPSPCIE